MPTEEVLYQGMTSVVPKKPAKMAWASAPATFLFSHTRLCSG
jgi:hypothetical protein